MGGRGHFKVQSDGSWSSMGGYMKAKVQKLDQQFIDKSKKVEKLSNLFEGIAIHVNGYTEPTNDELKMLMAQHGGKFHAYYSSTATTHVIASNLPRAKVKDLRPNQLIVRPGWVVDSVRERKVLPTQQYAVALRGASRNQTTLQEFSEKRKVSTSPDAATEASSSRSSSSRSIVPTADSAFLSEFYAHSRLHFLSTWKSELSDYVRSLTSRDDVSLAGCAELMRRSYAGAPEDSPGRRVILHVDMDCFFVSVSLLTRPHLRERPVAVTHHAPHTPAHHKRRAHPGSEKSCCTLPSSAETPPTGSDVVPSYSEIASCNYPARRAGLRNGMFYGRAKELCPDLVAVPYDFDSYQATSQKLYSILTSYTRHIEAVSCDEALLDVSSLVSETGLPPSHIAADIRESVKKATNCDASAGIGPNIALAKMATKMGKPNGQYEVTLDQVPAFMRDRPVESLPGVGRSTASRLLELGAPTCGRLQELTLDTLKKEFGSRTGQKLHELSRGIDDREVAQSKCRKSVSADVNYGIRLCNQQEVDTFLSNLAGEVGSRLAKADVTGKKVTLKVMVRSRGHPLETVKFGGHGVSRTVSRCKNLDRHTGDCDVIYKEARSLMKSIKVTATELRGVGIQITQLKSSREDDSKRNSIARFVASRPRASDDRSTTASGSKGATDARSDSNVPLDVARPVPNIPLDVGAATDEADLSQDRISCSFLQALPSDLQAEVKSNLKAHQAALHRKRPAKSPKKPSPNKLITDIFRPKCEDARRRLMDEIPTTSAASCVRPPPSLGGATTIPGARDAVRQWTETFINSPPLESDIVDVIIYLSGLITQSRDIAGACMVLHTLRRSIMTLIERCDIMDTQCDHRNKVTSLIDVYRRIATSLCDAVKENYDGASLDVKMIT